MISVQRRKSDRTLFPVNETPNDLLFEERKKKKSNESLLKNKTTLISATLKLLKGKAWSHNSVAAYHHGLQSYEYIDIAF